MVNILNERKKYKIKKKINNYHMHHIKKNNKQKII